MYTHTHTHIYVRDNDIVVQQWRTLGVGYTWEDTDQMSICSLSVLLWLSPALFLSFSFSFHCSSCASWNNTDLCLSTDHLWSYPACMVPQGTSRKFKTLHQSDTIIGVTSKIHYSWLYIVLSLFTERLHAYTLSSKKCILYYLKNHFNFEVICLMSAVIYSIFRFFSLKYVCCVCQI